MRIDSKLVLEMGSLVASTCRFSLQPWGVVLRHEDTRREYHCLDESVCHGLTRLSQGQDQTIAGDGWTLEQRTHKSCATLRVEREIELIHPASGAAAGAAPGAAVVSGGDQQGSHMVLVVL